MNHFISNCVARLARFTLHGLAGRKTTLLEAPPAGPPSATTKMMFVACFPKSGSTFVTRLLTELAACPIVGVNLIGGQNEQDMHEPFVLAAQGKVTVVHQHAKGTQNNVALMKRYGIRPVIQLRNIFDVVFSLQDHLQNESRLKPTGYVPDAYFSMTREDQLRFITQFHIPWYFNFYLSWLEHAHEVDGLWLTYEQLFNDPLREARRLSDFYGLEATDEQLCAALTAMSGQFTRLNVGISGRGADLPSSCREAIQEMGRCSGLTSRQLALIGIESSAHDSLHSASTARGQASRSEVARAVS